MRVAFAALAAALAACGPEAAPARHVPPGAGPILVGEFQSLSGPESARGLAFHRGFALALDEQNARGGVYERPLELQTYDDRGRADDAARAMSRLVHEAHAVLVVGGSTAELAAAAAAESAGVPFVSPAPGAAHVNVVRAQGAARAEHSGTAGLASSTSAGALPATPAAQAFRALYRSAHDGAEPDLDAARGYDCGQLALRAMERTRTFDPSDLWDALDALAAWDGASGRVELAR